MTDEEAKLEIVHNDSDSSDNDLEDEMTCGFFDKIIKLSMLLSVKSTRSRLNFYNFLNNPIK